MESASVSLYIELENGRRADLEVVARASLAFAGALKELAYILDPLLDVRVELASGTEGSLSLNSIIRGIKKHTGLDEKFTVKAVAAGALFWFGHTTADWTVHHILDRLAGQPEIVATLSPEEMDELAEKIATVLRKHVSQSQVQNVYRELERDTAVKGVGATTVQHERPTHIVPRGQFLQRAGRSEAIETVTSTRRVTTKDEHVTLISPVLMAGSRRWRFSSHLGEFGASIRDEEFLGRLLNGQIFIPMTGGIEMDVIVRTVEDNRDGVWQVTDRAILRVTKIHHVNVQHQLPLPDSDSP